MFVAALLYFGLQFPGFFLESQNESFKSPVTLEASARESENFTFARIEDDFGPRRNTRRVEVCKQSCDRDYQADTAECRFESSSSAKAVCYSNAASVYSRCLGRC